MTPEQEQERERAFAKLAIQDGHPPVNPCGTPHPLITNTACTLPAEHAGDHWTVTEVTWAP